MCRVGALSSSQGEVQRQSVEKVSVKHFEDGDGQTKGQSSGMQCPAVGFHWLALCLKVSGALDEAFARAN